MAKSSKILDKEYITNLNKNKTVPCTDIDRTRVITEWIMRGQELENDRSAIFIKDARLQKATILLASAVVGDRYHISIEPNNSLSIEDGLALLKFHYHKDRMVSALEGMLNEQRLSSNIMEHMAIQEQNKGIRLLLESMRDSRKLQEDCERYINNLMDRIDLGRNFFFGTFFSVLFGDHLFEIVYDEEDAKAILGLYPLSLGDMLPGISNKGIITHWEFTEKFLSGEKAITLNPYQVLRFMFMPDISFGELIGRGLYDSTKLINMLSHRMERLTVIARETRAIQTRVHFPNYKNLPPEMLDSLQVIKEPEVIAYKEKVRTQMIQRGSSVELFTNGLWDVKNVESDRADADFIKDVSYFDELFKTGLLVPPGLLDSGENVNRATMDLQIKFMKGLLNSLKDVHTTNMKQLFFTELLLRGISIDDIDLSVSYDNTGLIDTAEASQIVARLNNRFNSFPYPLLTKFMGIEWKDFLRATKQQKDSGIMSVSEPEEKETTYIEPKNNKEES